MARLQRKARSRAGSYKILIGLIFVTPLVAITLASIALTSFLDLESLRREVELQIRENLGLAVQFESRFSISLFPDFGIRTGRISLKVPGDWQSPIVAVDELLVSMQPIALLTKRLVIRKAFVSGLKINLTRLESGSANWEVVLQALQDKQVDTPDPTEDEGLSFGTFDVALQVEHLFVRNAGLSLRDKANDLSADLEGLELETKDLRLDAPITFKTGLEFDLDRLGINGSANAAGQIQLDLAASSYSVSGVAVRVIASGPGIPPALENPEFVGFVNYDDLSSIISLQKFTFSSGNVAASGDVMVRNPTTFPEVQGDVTVSSADFLSALVAGHEHQRRYPASASGRFAVSQDQIQVDQLKFLLDGKAMTGFLEASLGDRPFVNFDLKGGSINLHNLLEDVKSLAPFESEETPDAASAPVNTPGDTSLSRQLEQFASTLDDGLGPVVEAFAAVEKLLSWGRINGRIVLEELILPEVKLGQVDASLQVGGGIAGGYLDISNVAGGSARLDLNALRKRTSKDLSLSLSSRLENIDTTQLKLGIADDFGLVGFRGSIVTSGSSPAQMLRGASGFADLTIKREAGLVSLASSPVLPDLRPDHASFHFDVVRSDDGEPLVQHKVEARARIIDTSRRTSLAATFAAPIQFRAISDGLPLLGTVDLRAAFFRGANEDQVQMLALDTSFRLDPMQSTIDISKLDLSIDDQSLKFNGTARDFFAGMPQVNGKLNVASLDLPDLAHFVDLPLPDISPLTRIPVISTKVKFEVGPGKYLAGIDSLTLDEIRLAGSIEFEPGDITRLSYELKGGQIDLNQYLPAPPEPEPSDSGNSATKNQDEDFNSVNLFEGLDKLPLDEYWLKGGLVFDRIAWRDYVIKDLEFRSRLDRRVLSVDRFATKIFGGSIDGNMAANLNPDRRQINADFTFKRWEVDTLLELAGQNPELASGRLDARFRGKVEGDSINSFKRSLTGRAAFKLVNAVVSQESNGESDPIKLDIQQCTGRFAIRSGEFQNNDLRMIGPKFSARGRGRFHISEDTIDYTLEAKYGDLLSVPVIIRGSLSDPSLSAEFGKALGTGSGGLLDLPFRIFDPLILPTLR
jgi:uncharacterized protein involved in outer membrane biogenesis